MFKFGVKTKEAKWDRWNPTLEEMKSNYIKMQEKINKKKDFKVTYGTDATNNTIKVAVVFDFKKSTEAYNYVKEECTNYTALGPVSNVDGMLDKIKIIIKKAEENEMSKMTEERKETMVEAPEENVENNVPVTEETKVEMKNEKGSIEKPKDNSVSKASKDNMGVKIIDANTAEIATDSLFGNKLCVRALQSKETNRRKYLIFEVNKDGEELGTTSCDSLFRAAEVLNGSSKIKHLIQDFDGKYEGQFGDIMGRLSVIEKNRLLSPTITLDIDSCRTFEEFFEKLKQWFAHHMEDSRVAVVDINGKTHIALVKRGKQGLYEIFNSVSREVAPSLKATYIKGELYRRNLLIHDSNSSCNDTQLTVSPFVRAEIGILNDKIMSFVFDEDTIKEFKEAYEFYNYCFVEED